MFLAALHGSSVESRNPKLICQLGRVGAAVFARISHSPSLLRILVTSKKKITTVGNLSEVTC